MALQHWWHWGEKIIYQVLLHISWKPTMIFTVANADIQLWNRLDEEMRSLTGRLWASSSRQIWFSSIYQKRNIKAGRRLRNPRNCNDKKSIQGALVYSVHKWSLSNCARAFTSAWLRLPFGFLWAFAGWYWSWRSVLVWDRTERVNIIMVFG